jgi:hypothetical protein
VLTPNSLTPLIKIRTTSCKINLKYPPGSDIYYNLNISDNTINPFTNINLDKYNNYLEESDQITANLISSEKDQEIYPETSLEFNQNSSNFLSELSPNDSSWDENDQLDLNDNLIERYDAADDYNLDYANTEDGGCSDIPEEIPNLLELAPTLYWEYPYQQTTIPFLRTGVLSSGRG